jgi:hypothetical protein
VSRYRFHMRRLAVDPTGYYHPKWAEAAQLTVVAETETEAIRKAQTVSGEPGQRDRVYRFVVDRISDLEMAEAAS